MLIKVETLAGRPSPSQQGVSTHTEACWSESSPRWEGAIARAQRQMARRSPGPNSWRSEAPSPSKPWRGEGYITLRVGLMPRPRSRHTKLPLPSCCAPGPEI